MLKKLLGKKEYLLPLSAIILLLVSYQLAFKQTIVAWQLNHFLEQQLAQQTDMSFQPGYKERKNANLEKIIGRYRVDTLDFRSRVLGDLSAIAEKENVKLAEVPIRDNLNASSSIIIQRLNFEGDYSATLKVLGEFQQSNGLGWIRSVSLKSKTVLSGKENEKKLVMECYFFYFYK